VLEDEYLVITGFDKVSERQVYIFKVENLNQAIGMVGLDVSPAILIPFYDEDSSTLFATGRGKFDNLICVILNKLFIQCFFTL
jgi:coronin-7